jgi:hypothetical protein
MIRRSSKAILRGVGLWALGGLATAGGWGRAAEPADPAARLTFELDVMPILTAAGCNSGPCHGKQRGQNGFQLSLLGFDPDFDYAALAYEGHGRRLSAAAPAESLLLQKATGRVPHGGGARLDPEGPLYRTLLAWIEQDAPRSGPEDPVLSHISLAPERRTLRKGETAALTVTAHYADGSTREVAALTKFLSSEPAVVAVDERGVLRAGAISGEASIMARYLTEIATWQTGVAVEGEVDPAEYARLPRYNRFDDLVWDRLREMNLLPSGLCSDSTFLRRAHLDLIGRLPSADEARSFLEDAAPDKRVRLVDALLERPEYADYWATKWADLLRPNPYRVGIKATLSMDAWIRDVFRRNVPYDRWVRDLVAAQGSTWRNGAVTFFRDRREPEEITTAVCQLFLGVRLDCARCHHHPFEVWGQDHFYGMAAFFARVGRKGDGLSPPISGAEEMVFVGETGSVVHPLTGQPMAPTPLRAAAAAEIAPDEDPRVALAAWMTAPENEFFAKAGANRVWSELMGRGIVEPVDDLRTTNPPTNAPLLEALAAFYRENGFDQKKLLREIATSYVYQLSSLPNDRNASDHANYSRHYRRQLGAEVLLDAVGDVTGVGSDFKGDRGLAAPRGSRATEIWTRRTPSRFLDAFGRPDANLDPPCERLVGSTVVQALHMMNAPDIHAKVVDDAGRAAQLAASSLAPREIIRELYLSAYSRQPAEDELTALEIEFGDGSDLRRKATEDVLWSMLNSAEFLLSD